MGHRRLAAAVQHPQSTAVQNNGAPDGVQSKRQVRAFGRFRAFVSAGASDHVRFVFSLELCSTAVKMPQFGDGTRREREVQARVDWATYQTRV